jgi:hypothetical protein
MMGRRSALPVDMVALQKTIADQLRPRYEALLRQGRDPDEAYTTSYEQAVALLAKATNISQDKTKFEARGPLQQIMLAISR